MIIISDSAKERLLYLLGKKGENNEFVRVGVESGGCSGLSYKLDFDNTKTDDDSIVITNKYTDGINGNQVWFYKVINGDHEWPPGWPKRSGNGDLNTSEEIWKFFVIDMKNRGVL